MNFEAKNANALKRYITVLQIHVSVTYLNFKRMLAKTWTTPKLFPNPTPIFEVNQGVLL